MMNTKKGLAFGAALLCTATLSAYAPNFTKQVIDVSWSKHRVDDARAESLALNDAIWNCLCVHIAEHSIPVILPVDLSGDAERTGDLLLMLEGIFEEGFLGATGTIGGWRDAGTLGGLELRWSDGLNTVPGPSLGSHLEPVGEFQDSAQDTFGLLYCYDPAQMTARVAELEAETGGPLAMAKVWLGPTLLSSDSGSQAMKINGTENLVHGDVTTNGDFKVTGDDHTGENQIRYGGTSSIDGSGHDFPDTEQGTTGHTLPATPDTAANYQAQAVANGTSFVGDVTIKGGPNGLTTASGAPASGVVYATGRVYLEGNDLVGTITVVSELGISISGDSCSLTSAVDDVLLYVIGGAVPDERLDNNVLIDGRLGGTTGSIWAPGGLVEVVATSRELTGRIVAEKIRCAGYGNTITDGSE